MKNVIVVVVLLLLGIAAWYYFGTDRSQPEESAQPEIVEQAVPEPPPPPPPQPAREPVVVPEKAPAPEPELEAIPLPELSESDPVAAELLGSLLGESVVERYVAADDTIPRAVAAIDSLDSAQVPGAIQAVKGPEGEFLVTANDQPATPILNEAGDPVPQFLSDPANSRRYLVYVEMLEAMDAEQAVAMYRQHYPLFQEAFQQLGYPEGDFNQRLLAVIDELLATPEVDEPLSLMKPEAYYLFTDEGLESLPAGQKILIRMGSENAARVKSKLAEIRQVLLREAAPG